MINETMGNKYCWSYIGVAYIWGGEKVGGISDVDTSRFSDLSTGKLIYQVLFVTITFNESCRE